jgi:hypothetical protein
MPGNPPPLTSESCEASGTPFVKPSPNTPRRLANRGSGCQPDLNYHRIRCTICSHPDREAIEQDFLHWVRPSTITHEYQLGDRRAVGRHARAFGLFEQRTARTQHALDLIIEQAETVEATANDIIRAVRAHSCLDENGRWHEPTRRVIITHQTVTLDASSGSHEHNPRTSPASAESVAFQARQSVESQACQSVALQACQSVALQACQSVALRARQSIGTPAERNSA